MQTPAKQLNVAPERSLDQRMDALKRANEVRSRRAGLKVDLKRGRGHHRLGAARAARVPADRQGGRPAHGGAQVRPRQVGPHHGAVPRQPEQDRRRSVRPSARRAAGLLRGLTIPSVFVVSGPSGAGKGTVIGLVRQALPDVVTSVSATTRPPRPGEIDGRAVPLPCRRAQFRRAVGAGDFLEWVDYSGNLYGTLRADVDAKLAAGYDVILEIELAGRAGRPQGPCRRRR